MLAGSGSSGMVNCEKVEVYCTMLKSRLVIGMVLESSLIAGRSVVFACLRTVTFPTPCHLPPFVVDIDHVPA